ncbi:glycosyl transferase [Acidaminobacter sp. JC074]|uniref:biosynthetic peptidoglycan transglycosylase n=1 Tax=Acidaminobacter sp. JC074 TaxID=2530199 RepID=UPI001F0DAAB9|nr:biosynthetic peptidoglycan transglycosylase [Acidaminobacter sp. JC074]MCH4889661.1 glycosyl transferase [Acidaminobacter sp. JC074]
MKKFIISIFLIIFLGGLVVGGKIAFDGYKLYEETMADVEIENVVSEIRNRDTYVVIDDIPSHFLEAIIAVEDHRFMGHNGFDVISFGRAVIRNFKENEFAAGGSTITQQLSKNLFFSFEKKLERKVAELIVARQLEDMYKKDEILELYVNIIYYGDGFENLYDASMGYYNKAPKDMTDAEGTLLAGLPQAPSTYAMIENFDRAVKRAFEVVDAMVEHKVITENDGDLLKIEIENVQLAVD